MTTEAWARSCGRLPAGGEFGGAMDALADAMIGGAAAEVARHGLVDVLVAGVRVALEEGGGGHELAGLAITALGHVEFAPGLLQGMRAVGGKTFDGGDLRTGGGGDGSETTAGRLAVEMDSTGAALADATAELGADEAEGVAKHPEKRGVGGHIDGVGLAVYVQGVVAHG